LVENDNALSLVPPEYLYGGNHYRFFVVNLFFSGIVFNEEIDFGFVSYGYEVMSL